jgi:hypothetical protein
MTELLEKLKSIFSVTEPGLVITDELIECRNQLMTRMPRNGRNDYEFAMHVDCVFLEEWLIKCGLVDAPLPEHYTPRGACVYDCRIKLLNSTAFVDFKCIDKNNDYNLAPHKFEKRDDGTSWETWVRDGIIKGLLTDYCFYRMYRPENRPLRVDDMVQFELINVLNSRFVIKSLNESVRHPGGKFYRVEKV